MYLFRIDIRWQRRVVTLLDLLAKGVKVHLVSIEGGLEGCHLVEQASQGPDVRSEVVTVLVDSLRGHVVGSANWNDEKMYSINNNNTIVQLFYCTSIQQLK